MTGGALTQRTTNSGASTDRYGTGVARFDAPGKIVRDANRHIQDEGTAELGLLEQLLERSTLLLQKQAKRDQALELGWYQPGAYLLPELDAGIGHRPP